MLGTCTQTAANPPLMGVPVDMPEPEERVTGFSDTDQEVPLKSKPTSPPELLIAHNTNPFATAYPDPSMTSMNSAARFQEDVPDVHSLQQVQIEFGDQAKSQSKQHSKQRKNSSKKLKPHKQTAAGAGAGGEATKKRKLTSTTTVPVHVKQEPGLGDVAGPGALQPLGQGSADVPPPPAQQPNDWQTRETVCDATPTLQWEEYHQHPWQPIVDEFGRPAGPLQLEINVDKGFAYSPLDKAFVCQRKNHFQLAVSMLASNQPRFIQSAPGRPLYALKDVFVYTYGYKVENAASIVQIEQANVDRSRTNFEPLRLELTGNEASKITLARLHFSETTANNMRKKGKPNQDQRFFSLVISVMANIEGRTVTLCSLQSQRIVVRASNLAQFAENEAGQQWSKAEGHQATVHFGTVGINNARPTEALSVHGNVQVTGAVMQPSDLRVKENLRPMDSKAQLANVKKLNLYEYELKESWAAQAGRLGSRTEQGVVAQEVQQILPEAVRGTNSNIQLDDGVVENLLTVNKERIFMEGVGAVQELCKMTENLENRIKELEILNEQVRQEAAKERAATQTTPLCDSGADKMEFPIMRAVLYIGLTMMVFCVIAVSIIIVVRDDDSKGSDQPSEPDKYESQTNVLRTLTATLTTAITRH